MSKRPEIKLTIKTKGAEKGTKATPFAAAWISDDGKFLSWKFDKSVTDKQLLYALRNPGALLFGGFFDGPTAAGPSENDDIGGLYSGEDTDEDLFGSDPFADEAA